MNLDVTCWVPSGCGGRNVFVKRQAFRLYLQVKTAHLIEI